MIQNAPRRVVVIAALLTLYVVWGSTYLAMRIALVGFPPLLMGGLRFTTAGLLLGVIARFGGSPLPTARQWWACARIGVLLLTIGNGGVAIAEQWVASGLAAVVVASVPLWTALIGGLVGAWPSRRQIVGLGIGACGVVLLNLDGDLRGNPLGALALLTAAICWSAGSIWSRRMDLPKGLMASAAQMLCAGIVLGILAIAHGDRLVSPLPASSMGAVTYLALFGSVLAYSAYGYLLRNVGPTLATSYAFVNPVVAVLLGAVVAREHVGPAIVVAMVVILAGVSLVLFKTAPRG